MSRNGGLDGPHLLCIDDVYVEEDGDLRFVAAPAPTQAELLPILERIVTRVTKWLARKGPRQPSRCAWPIT